MYIIGKGNLFVKFFSMIKLITVLLLILNFFQLSGCKSGSDDPVEVWDQIHFTEFGRQPLWSPDGEYVLFGNDTPGSAGLYLWDLNNNPVVLHADIPAHNWDYGWSPNGSRIAFSSPGGADDSLAGIWVYDVDADTLIHVFDNGRDVSWLYNSLEVVFRIDNYDDNPPGIYKLLIPVDNEELADPSLLIANAHKPKGSPQNDFIAYSDNEIDGRMHVVDLDLEEVYHSGTGAVHWNWSYDGYKLVYIVNDYLSGSLSEVLWGVDVLHPENADTLVRWATYPTSDESAEQVAFVRVQTGRVAGLWLYRAGDGEHRIASFGQNPSFHPTEDKIAMNSAGGGIRILQRVR